MRLTPKIEDRFDHYMTRAFLVAWIALSSVCVTAGIAGIATGKPQMWPFLLILAVWSIANVAAAARSLREYRESKGVSK